MTMAVDDSAERTPPRDKRRRKRVPEGISDPPNDEGRLPRSATRRPGQTPACAAATGDCRDSSRPSREQQEHDAQARPSAVTPSTSETVTNLSQLPTSAHNARCRTARRRCPPPETPAPATTRMRFTSGRTMPAAARRTMIWLSAKSSMGWRGC